MSASCRTGSSAVLLRWLERATGRTQVVSTTSTSLLPRVQDGTFVDTLYYRLNTVCLDVA